jgi:hypothetical protein
MGTKMLQYVMSAQAVSIMFVVIGKSQGMRYDSSSHSHITKLSIPAMPAHSIFTPSLQKAAVNIRSFGL